MSVSPDSANQANMSVSPDSANQANMSVSPDSANQANMSMTPDTANISLRKKGNKYHWVGPIILQNSEKSTSLYLEEMITPKKMSYIGVVRYSGNVLLFAIAVVKKYPVDVTWCQNFAIPFTNAMQPVETCSNIKNCCQYMKKMALDRNVEYEEHGKFPTSRQKNGKQEEYALEGTSTSVPSQKKRKVVGKKIESNEPVTAGESTDVAAINSRKELSLKFLQRIESNETGESSKNVKANPSNTTHDETKKLYLHGDTGVRRHENDLFILKTENPFRMSAPVNFMEVEQRLLEYIQHPQGGSDPKHTTKKTILMVFRYDDDPSAMGSQTNTEEMEQHYCCKLSRDLSLGVYAGPTKSDLNFAKPQKIIIIAKSMPKNKQEWTDWEFWDISKNKIG
jgi:hypothetical protein